MLEGFSSSIPEIKVEKVTAEPTPIERLVSQRWETINKSLEGFEEREPEDSFNPERFMAETTEAWEARHGTSEQHVDTTSPFDRANFLLGLLIEKGAEWSAQKRVAVRRATVGFIDQSVGAMTILQQEVFRNTVLSDRSVLDEIGRPKEGEQKLVTQWLQDTVGRGIRR